MKVQKVLLLCAVMVVLTCTAACGIAEFDPMGIPGIAVISDSFHGNALAKLDEGNVLFVYTENGDVYNPVEDKYEKGCYGLVIYYSGGNIEVKKYTGQATVSGLNSAYDYAVRVRQAKDTPDLAVTHKEYLERTYLGEAQSAKQIKVVQQDYCLINEDAGYVIVRSYATVYEMGERVVIVFESQSQFVPGIVCAFMEEDFNKKAKNEGAGISLSLLQDDEEIKRFFPTKQDRSYIRPLCSGAYAITEEGNGWNKTVEGIGWNYNDFTAPRNLPSLDKTEHPVNLRNVIVIETVKPNYGGSVDVEVRIVYKAGGKRMDKAFTVTIPLKDNNSQWIIG